MGFLRKKKNKTNQSISNSSGTNGASLITKESTAAVIAPTTTKKNKTSSSMRQVSKAKMTEDEPLKLDDTNRHSHDSSEPYSPTATEYSNGSSNGESYTREVTDEPRASSTKGRGPWFTSRSTKLFKNPPPAQQAAYTGPPRYDWVDIVSRLLYLSYHYLFRCIYRIQSW